MNNLKHLTFICCLLGMGLFSWSTVGPAWGAVPIINNIDNQPALGGTEIIYIDQINNITIDGNNAGSFNAVTITVDGVDTAFDTSNHAGNFNCTFDCGETGSAVTVRARAQNSTSVAQLIWVDITPPDTPELRWKVPDRQPCMASNLFTIYTTDPLSDPGGTGIDWDKCYITVSAVPGSTSKTAAERLEFIPQNGYPADNPGGHDFHTGTMYNLFLEVYDMADNFSNTNGSFCYNGDVPEPRIQWESPNRGFPPSYYMGQGLTRIWLECGCTNCNPPIIEHANSTLTVLPLPAPNAGSQLDGDGEIDWHIPTPPDYHTNFAHGLLYTVSAYLEDKAGKSATATREFKKDNIGPVIQNVKVINALMNPVDLTNDDVVMRGSHMKNPYFFYADVSDTPSDWGGHTSLNGSGLGDVDHHPWRPSYMGICDESGSPLNKSR